MKAWAYVAIIVAIIAAIGGTYAAGHSAGYDKRDQQVQQEIIAAQKVTRKAEEQKWSAAVKASQESIKIEEVIVEKINVVEKEIPKIVKVVETIRPECNNHFATNYSGVLNNQVRAANSIQSAETPASVVN